jgi:hypothetical protein
VAGGFAVADSAGVRIATSATPEWSDTGGWRVGEAVLDIGATDDDPDHELFRVVGAVRLADGGLAVANAGSNELRFFAVNGALVKRTGRKGEGPGEFTRIEGLWPFRGDSLIVWDRGLARLSVFTSAGELGRILSPERKGLNPHVLPPLDDGTFILEDLWLDPGPEGRPWPLYNHYSAFTADGVFLDSLPAQRAYMAITIPDYRILSPIFGARLVATAGGDGYVIGTAEDYELRHYDPQGRLKSITRWAGPDRTVSGSDVAEYRRAEAERIADDNARRAWAAALAKLPAEDRFPAYGYIARSRRGEFWLLDYTRPGHEDEPWHWTVLAPDGRWLGGITTESGVLPLDIDVDHVVLLARDDLGVEHVRVHPINRNTQGG